MQKRVFGLVIMAFIVSGCATTTSQPVSNAEKAKVSSVTLAEEVRYPPQMYYLGPGGVTAGAMFGVIGAVLDAPRIESERQAFQAEAIRTTSIDRIVFEETIAQLRTSKKFSFAERSVPGGSTMRVTVTQYGFSIPNGFSSKLVPILRVQFDLTDASGRPIWTGTARSTPLRNPVEAIDAEVIARSPAAREAAWREVARALAKELLASY